jgi:hypothetical protein
MYAENPAEPDATKDILKVCLVECPWILLADVAAIAAVRKLTARLPPPTIQPSSND